MTREMSTVVWVVLIGQLVSSIASSGYYSSASSGVKVYAMSTTQVYTTPNAVTNGHPMDTSRPTLSASSSSAATTVESSDGSSSSAAGTQLSQIMINYNKISQSPPMNGSTDWLNGFYDLMRTEWTRLRTFHARQDWPHRFITAEELANAGFFYTSNEDRVQCAFCRGVVSHWKSGDRALSEHSIHFPLCPFIMEMDVGNVPIGRDPIRDPKARHDVCGNMSSYGDTNSVLNSISINRRDVDMKALDTHMSEFGVQPHNGPKNPEYNSIDARKRSYYINGWDQSIPVSMDSLAEAGFFSVVVMKFGVNFNFY
ncbi:unnamed protein product [Medioppia subpectinata]|uniref:Uncharacterized protein n=1 Tax=Medioppia subpectinata TaxID=1979941 RepID=A0A7R9L9F0_9ACAR|nr:unnamed protein product [Medioppia subpectinata]CAG2117069.1 unnamed protein product [Medioppia subpectinata]